MVKFPPKQDSDGEIIETKEGIENYRLTDQGLFYVFYERTRGGKVKEVARMILEIRKVKLLSGRWLDLKVKPEFFFAKSSKLRDGGIVAGAATVATPYRPMRACAFPTRRRAPPVSIQKREVPYRRSGVNSERTSRVAADRCATSTNANPANALRVTVGAARCKVAPRHQRS